MNIMANFSTENSNLFTEKNVNSKVDIKSTPEDKLYSDYQLSQCASWITDHNYQRTCLQFPAKLLNDGISIALYLEKIFHRSFYILAESAFGSCCVDHISAEHVNSDSIIHFGHACMSPFFKLPVLYIFEKEELDVKDVKDSLENLICNSSHVIIFYDDVYHHLYKNLCDIFVDNDQVQIAKISIPDNGEIKADKSKVICGRIVPAFSENSSAVFLGNESAVFQNLVLALPDITWYQYMQTKGLKKYNVNRSKFLMKKYYLIELIKDAKVLGILAGTLGIDSYLAAIERIKSLAKHKGKKCYVLAVGRPSVSKLANFPEIDVFVSISCMENALMDYKEYYKPVVTFFEVEMALGPHHFTTQYTNDFRDALLNYSSLNEIEDSYETNISLATGKARVCNENPGVNDSMELQEKTIGTLVEAKGAEYLRSRSWKGLEQNTDNKNVLKAEMGRCGIPQGYENEYLSLKQKDT